MGILIRLKLLGNKEELNVKILNDDCLSEVLDNIPNVIADFNFAIDKKSNSDEVNLMVECTGKSDLKRNSEDIGKEVGNCALPDDIYGKNFGNLTVQHSGNIDINEDLKLEEYFVIDKILGNRYNPLTKQYEFLLKLKDCVPTDNIWKSVDSRKTELPDKDGQLYIQKTPKLLSLKERAIKRCNSLHDKSATRPTFKGGNPILVDLGDERLPLNSRICLQNVEQSCCFSDSYSTGCQDVEKTAETSTNFLNNATVCNSESNLNGFFNCMDSMYGEDFNVKCEPAVDGITDLGELYGNQSEELMNFGRESFSRDEFDGIINGNEEDRKSESSEQSCLADRLICKFCGRVFTAIHYLKMHMTVHSKVKQFTCSVCRSIFDNPKMLQLHEQRVHSIRHRRKRRKLTKKKQLQYRGTSKRVKDNKVFNCNLCTRTFADKGKLECHATAHSKGRMHTCSTCGRAFTFQHSLKNHVKTHSNVKKFPCTFCSKLFSILSRLKLHEHKHEIEMSNLRRNQKSPHLALSKIRKIPSEERVHKCLMCAKSFRLKNTLQIHVRQHTGEKPYACHVCDYRSIQRSSLSSHLQKHEKGLL